MPDGRPIQTSADRQRRYRQRQRAGARIVPLEIGEVEADAVFGAGGNRTMTEWCGRSSFLSIYPRPNAPLEENMQCSKFMANQTRK